MVGQGVEGWGEGSPSHSFPSYTDQSVWYCACWSRETSQGTYIHSAVYLCRTCDLCAPPLPSQNPTGVVQVHETRQKFLDGTLHPVNVLMCPNQ